MVYSVSNRYYCPDANKIGMQYGEWITVTSHNGQDCYRVVLSEGGTLKVQVINDPPYIIKITLYDENCIVLKETVCGGNASINELLKPGTYYVTIAQYEYCSDTVPFGNGNYSYRADFTEVNYNITATEGSNGTISQLRMLPLIIFRCVQIP